jgi:putative uncharacterized protein (fragment)
MLCERQEVVRYYDSRLTLYSDGKLVIRDYDSAIQKFSSGVEEYISDDIYSVADLSSVSTHSSKKEYDKYGNCRVDNLSRSRKLVIDLAYENQKIWKSFLTLTFSENIKDIDYANKCFNCWLTSIRQSFVDFAYLCVPEFQKRGAVHYHLLTNLDVGSDLLPVQNHKKNMYDVKYWSYGFTSAFDLRLADDRFNVSLYVCKYLYKDIDSRLFGRKKILHSRNLNLPKVATMLHSNTYVLSIIAHIVDEKDITEFIFEPKKKFQIGFKEQVVFLSHDDMKKIDFLFNKF